MAETTNQPRECDAVLGGQSPQASAAVLGGIEAVKRRFQRGETEQKIAALQEALKYGEAGYNWVLQALGDSSEQIEQAAYQLLQENASLRGKQALLELEYRRLEHLLSVGRWQEADCTTSAIMLMISERQKEGSLSLEDLENFPCDDLRTLDELWLNYSNQRFSFSIQTSIWHNIGGKFDPDWETWCHFGETIGWFRNGSWLYWNDVDFTLNAPIGHLPRGGAFMGWGLGDFWTGCRMLSSLTSKFTNRC